MNLLFLGGTRFFGVHAVEALLEKGHDVAIATRGNRRDDFGGRVERLAVERTNRESLRENLGGRHFDVAYDNLAYSSNDVRVLLDSIAPGRYIMASSASVYGAGGAVLTEADFDPFSYELRWCEREEVSYPRGKRQAESALFQRYPEIPSVAVRFPFVVGRDDYTRRLRFYVEHIVGGRPMWIDNPDARQGFTPSREAGAFLAWLAEVDCTGPINAASSGSISIAEILDYVARRTGRKALLSPKGDPAPYNGNAGYPLDTSRAENLGFAFSNIRGWIYELLDGLIEESM